ncbi:ImmA/IrrE family metallo-endopeptidase [Halobacillus litoralis]|uniref:ImmA/IrrE family metallo-endopeptidase n=1 Tax=Halobacillus litoralis TaxID=45668 RepID=UPI0013711758|nr:ImmA/IrrE family metallo-endopeptidase [Halobacillus litoralis]MYL39056.1 ImmA/IrrE family metallo-endopeptidase [Halobacillus litoralis]
MNSKKRKKINTLSNTLLHHLNIDSPIDNIYDLVRELGGNIKEEDLEDGMEAKIVKNNEEEYKFTIYLNPDTLNEKRRRFSIAHELGHLFLHMGYLIDENKWNNITKYEDSVYYRFGHNEEEYEANEFAASLLMPEEEFKEVARQHYSKGYYSIGPIAEHFKVSEHAATNRGRWLDIFSWE